jgi:hypothetical protein
MKQHFVNALLAVTGLCGLIAPAHADSALAEISGLRFDVIDLDPNDGIAPSFNIEQLANGVLVNDQRFDYVAGTPGSRESQTAGQHAVASWDLQGGHLLASATTFSPGGESSYADVLYYAQGMGASCCVVVLSPNTRLEIHGTARASITGGGMVFVGYKFGIPGNGSLGDFKTNEIALSHNEPGTVSQDLDLSWSFDNTGTGERYWEFALLASAYASPATAVPEPGIALLAGLGVMTVLASRRKKPHH